MAFDIKRVYPLKYLKIYLSAGVVELADTHGSGPCAREGIGVQVPSPALYLRLLIINKIIPTSLNSFFFIYS